MRRNAVEWSDSFFALVGLEPGQVTPSFEAWMATIHPDDGQLVQKAMDEARFAGDPIDMEWRAVLPGGSIRWLMSRCHLEKDAQNTPVRYTGISLDITERKAAEERRTELERTVNHLQRLESLGRLASGVAHDMNNVLGVIMAIGSFLQESQDPGILKDAERLVRAAKRGRDLVKGLRDFGRKKLESATEIDLNEVVRREADMIERTCLKRVAVKLALEPGLATVFGEGTSIQNAVMNLCVNAMDAMPDQGTLTISTRRMRDDFVELVVEDDGEGMPPEVLARALEPFFTTKPVGKGTGLGLSQVYGTMKAHGGSVNIESVLGKGTQVHLEFPVTGQCRTPQPVPCVAPVTARALTVLLVDDEEPLHGPVLDLLRSLGHTGQAVASGQEALSAIQGGMPADLVMLDLRMPEMDGEETLRRLRIQRPELPVLLVTGNRDERLHVVLSRYTRVHTLMKPFARADLAGALSALLREVA